MERYVGGPALVLFAHEAKCGTGTRAFIETLLLHDAGATSPVSRLHKDGVVASSARRLDAWPNGR
jgi:hypothetical protein